VLRSIESGMDEDGGGDDSADGPVAKGRLYGVTAGDGVQLYTSPSDLTMKTLMTRLPTKTEWVVENASSMDDERRIVGMWSKDD